MFLQNLIVNEWIPSKLEHGQRVPQTTSTPTAVRRPLRDIENVPHTGTNSVIDRVLSNPKITNGTQLGAKVLFTEQEMAASNTRSKQGETN